MFHLYGKTYVKTESEMVNSLFRPIDGRTENGTYKLTKRGVYLYDQSGAPRVFIRRDGVGPVSVSKHRGRYRYMRALCTLDSQWIGEPKSYLASVDGANMAVETHYKTRAT